MFNRTNLTLSARTLSNRLNLGTRSLALNASVNDGDQTLRIRHAHHDVMREGMVWYDVFPIIPTEIRNSVHSRLIFPAAAAPAELRDTGNPVYPRMTFASNPIRGRQTSSVDPNRASESASRVSTGVGHRSGAKLDRRARAEFRDRVPSRKSPGKPGLKRTARRAASGRGRDSGREHRKVSTDRPLSSR